MDALSTYEYISSLTREQLSAMDRIRSIVTLKKIVKIIVRDGDQSLGPPTWIYIGIKHDHIIIPRFFCTCKHFVIRVMMGKNTLSCTHLLAQKLAEETNSYRVAYMDRGSYLNTIREIIKYGRSPTLRKVLYTSNPR